MTQMYTGPFSFVLIRGIRGKKKPPQADEKIYVWEALIT